MENAELGNAKRTPLYEAHEQAGGKIVDFHGWLLPIQYGSILQEHETVRTKAGLFDVSHMGEIEVSGPGAFEFLQRLLTNDIDAKPGKAVYSPMCYPDGGTVDDLIVYRLSSGKYILVVNAANAEKDFNWIKDCANGTAGTTVTNSTNSTNSQISVINRSAEYAQIAIQGPASQAILQQIVTLDLSSIRTYHFVEEVNAGGATVLLSRTGYTGEDGFELYCRPEDARRLWDTLLDKGRSFGLLPAGLGARDTLRLEAAMPLYGQELSERISPVAAGLERFIKPGKGAFNGRGALTEQLDGSLKKRVVGFEMVDRAVPRTGYEIYKEGVLVGTVTSGGFFPTLRKNMGLALVDTNCSSPYDTFEVKVRDGFFQAKIVELPFYSRAR